MLAYQVLYPQITQIVSLNPRKLANEEHGCDAGCVAIDA